MLKEIRKVLVVKEGLFRKRHMRTLGEDKHVCDMFMSE
jgi:hypothetical protein